MKRHSQEPGVYRVWVVQPSVTQYNAIGVANSQENAERLRQTLGSSDQERRRMRIRERAIIWVTNGWHIVHMKPISCAVPMKLVKHLRYPSDKLPRRLHNPTYSFKERIKIFFTGRL